jgi:L-lactate dehydrogenase (cytochrome)
MLTQPQLYMNRDRAASEKAISGLADKGFKAIMLTVDASVAGKRELDQRAKGDVGAAVSSSLNGGSS